eukprot:TRINITY_DN3853_c0_g1_i1.p1 TRINITY_DN3853_c0_g1~~TRINITY_DN3853_c0_g1_i1.p1  ORF type:complete len:675 (+),score=87.40 TRINITY_DN3853_c0_g1_i1:175-2199(+)
MCCWFLLVVGFALIRVDGQSIAQKELGLYGTGIGAKVAIESATKSEEEYNRQETIDAGLDFLAFEGSMSTLHSDLQPIVDECEVNPEPAEGKFVQVQGTQFIYNGQPFYFMGMNAYQLVNIERNLNPGDTDIAFQKAKDLGLQTIRLWAFSDEIRKSPTEWDEKTFEALDSLVNKAKQYDLKVVLALLNYWEQFNGTDSQVTMVKGTIKGYTIEDFYTNEEVKLLYKSHACKIINRVNSISGVKYRDDPTIMSWNLLNEARCTNCNGGQQHSGLLGGLVSEWMDEMAAFLKSIDPNHLVTTGMEGFFGRFSPMSVLGLNPGSYGQCTGNDFTLSHNSPNIDYAVLHVYPDHKVYDFDNDIECDMECVLNWLSFYIQQHFDEARNVLGKPMVIEEFGLSVRVERKLPSQEILPYNEQERVDFYKRVMGMFLQSAQSGDTGAGVMMWLAAVRNYEDYDGFTIYLDADELAFEGSSALAPISPRRFRLLQKFRKEEELLTCGEAEYSAAEPFQSVRLVDATPPSFVVLQGSNVLEVISDCYNQLVNSGLYVDFGGESTVSRSPTQPSIATILTDNPQEDGFEDYQSQGCTRLDASVIGGELVEYIQADSFESCCESCQGKDNCNAFVYCDVVVGCFDRFAFIPHLTCELFFQQAIQDGDEPEITYAGEDTQLSSGYL